ncbi:hypothetical protein NB636_06195 [Oxalobacter aliiformigenes]|uniref:hypothetical protein n=1 Tax=Oxalobacter aliiformigenes TaxID=2946593 RepID=UPI0022AFFEEA|nr:hypothetical protein [Oxalobacter aliiformigenes]WAV98332.1 hypothetical protein NB636_06195 [Oxalobacter aliiformigenes]
MTVAQIQTNPTNLDVIDKINEIIQNLLYVDDSTIKISGGVISVAQPNGSIYVQYPGKSAPADLYGGEWTNISAQFAGQFFRAEGGNASAFGSPQDGGAPNIMGELPSLYANEAAATGSFYQGASYSVDMPGGHGVPYVRTGFSAANSNGYYNTNEVRPYNTAIRIWEKTG